MKKEKNIEWKKKKYLQACRILDLFNEKYNLCNIRKENGKVTCNGVFKNREGLCCDRCGHLTKNGCSIDSLGCKFNYCYFKLSLSENGLCEVGSSIEKEFNRIRTIIKDFINKHNIPGYNVRMSMEDSFKMKFKTKMKHYNFSDYDDDKAEFLKED